MPRRAVIYTMRAGAAHAARPCAAWLRPAPRRSGYRQAVCAGGPLPATSRIATAAPAARGACGPAGVDVTVAGGGTS